MGGEEGAYVSPWPGPGGTFSASLTLFSYSGWTVIHLPPGTWVALSPLTHALLFQHQGTCRRSLSLIQACLTHRSWRDPYTVMPLAQVTKATVLLCPQKALTFLGRSQSQLAWPAVSLTYMLLSSAHQWLCEGPAWSFQRRLSLRPLYGHSRRQGRDYSLRPPESLGLDHWALASPEDPSVLSHQTPASLGIQTFRNLRPCWRYSH